jgi:hypothetical protein
MSCTDKEVEVASYETVKKADRFTWPLISEREGPVEPPLTIEPGEKGRIDYEFAIPSSISVVRIYSFFPREQRKSWVADLFTSGNQPKDETGALGWNKSTFYVIK